MHGRPRLRPWEIRRMTNGEGVDIVLDAVGGETLAKSYRLLRPAGRLMTFGFSAAMAGWLASN